MLPLRLRFIPTLTAFSFGAAITALILAMIFIPNTNAVRSLYLANYGNALANMAAKQAVDATFSHDLVRLQVIMQDVISNPHTQLATIHDVENKLLVQAGDSRASQAGAMAYTSPIVLHDTVAGYVTVSLNGSLWSSQSSHMLVFAILILCTTVGLWSLMRHNAIERVQIEKPVAKDMPDPDEDTEDTQNNDSGNDNLEPPKPEVFAVVHIKNLNVLKQQLAGASFRETLGRLEGIISDVVALYGGHKFELVDNYYVLRFYERENRGEALFNASCSAYLILELAGIIDKIPLDLAALVSANPDHIQPEKLPFAGLIIEATAGSESLINRRIEFMELGTEDGRQVLSSFHQPFKTLLENQRKQLSQYI